MKRRREHGECDIREGGRGCLVFGTKVCTFRKAKRGRLEGLKRWLTGVNTAVWWFLFAVVGVLLGCSGMWMKMRVEAEA